MDTIVCLQNDFWLLVDAKEQHETTMVRHFEMVMATE